MGYSCRLRLPIPLRKAPPLTQRKSKRRLKGFTKLCPKVPEELRGKKSLLAALPQFLGERFRILGDRLKVLALQVNGGVPCSATIPEQMIEALEAYLQTSGRFRVSAFLNRDIRPADAAELLSEVSNFLLLSMSRAPQFSNAERPSELSATFPANAKPKLQNVGGGQRVLAVIPDPQSVEVWKSFLQNDFGTCVSACSTKAVDICVVCETEGIAIPAVVDAVRDRELGVGRIDWRE